ncbi:MAG: isoleucine--tRNA ligase [Candidatus Gastranaerophilales bacterium]|nr:isoleucine--tRNA ligase [Candidatus Gastranaerophilales bacterium]
MAESTKVEYKDTINLPQTSLQMRANATQKELQTQKFWEENNIYEKNLAQRDKTKSFILHDGPPYLSSEKIHVGTALNKILKDILIKYKSQRGYYAPYVPGYDGHGLPIENAVVKKIKGGREALTPAELRTKCREFALKNLKGQESEFKRLGVWGDWEHPYLTIAAEYEAEQIRVFGEMFKKGYIEKGKKPVYWCASCETALAEAEVEYADITSTSIYVRFKFDEEEKAKAYQVANVNSNNDLYAIIWTTTPWTIPSNRAICLNSRLEYTIFEYKGANYLVATDLLDTFVSAVEWDKNEVKSIGGGKGADFEHLKTTHPLYSNIKSPIILGDHVTLEAGTGCVHTAPGHGLEDWEACQRYGIETFSPLNSKGIWVESKDFNDNDLLGVPYYKGHNIIMDKLESTSALVFKQDITHSYPHCWRCKNPVIYRATDQWFVKMDKFRNQTLKAIKDVKWIPASGESRISNMVEGRTDWCISRQRAWGVPIPVFYCDDCGEVIVTDETINHVADMFDKESSDAWVKYSEKELMPQGFKCPKCGGVHFTKEKDIMDVWFDSGVSWKAVVEKRNAELGHTPVDMYLEGSDQHRGWFQSSLLTSIATQEKAPYKQVLTHGFVFGEDGRKMSKSLGNYIRPDDIIKNYGADILRLWAASVDYRNDIKIGDNIIKQLVEIFKKTRNTARFLLGNLFDFDPSVDYVNYDELKNIDKFALHKLNVLIKNVTEAFESYEFYKYFQHLQNFAAIDLSSFYLDIVKDRLYTQGKKSLSRRACQTVLYEMSQAITKILVPVMPHQAEDIWTSVPDSQKGGLESVLLTNWPEFKPEWENNDLDAEFNEILKLREIATKAIEPLRADKKIGSSLEVAVWIETDKKDLIQKYENELCNIFITSQAILADKKPDGTMNELEEDGYKIYVTKALGEKCERCWKYRELGTVEGHPTICQDCYDAISYQV